ncbi:acylphosphatase [Aerococcus agrisoli]|uniref:acylphosphatase n=1 Tax=Aerococcus agrisoli TaxID=2487350 RepID=A0A3N4GEW4_9LACT|nr:acylphosphatase [Aerococcus agrisoli]RPA61302.1 acylphosphatase [Aerococcus agrisoli]
MKTYKYHVIGRVQGVGFRNSTTMLGTQMGLGGSARNLDDGSVEVIVQADEEQLAEFLQALKHNRNNPFARVDGIQLIDSYESEKMTKFSAIY